MTNNKAYDFFFKINRNNDVTENQIVESLSILLEKHHNTQIHEWHKNLVLNITFTSEPHNTIWSLFCNNEHYEFIFYQLKSTILNNHRTTQNPFLRKT